MKSGKQAHVRVLTAGDLDQSRFLYGALCKAIERHKPDLVALLGDVLDSVQAFFKKRQFTVAECANRLAALPVEHLIFSRSSSIE